MKRPDKETVANTTTHHGPWCDDKDEWKCDTCNDRKGYWNYRVVKLGRGGYGVREIYYDHCGNPVGATGNDAAPFGETVEELERDARLILDAILNSEVIDITLLDEG